MVYPTTVRVIGTYRSEVTEWVRQAELPPLAVGQQVAGLTRDGVLVVVGVTLVVGPGGTPNGEPLAYHVSCYHAGYDRVADFAHQAEALGPEWARGAVRPAQRLPSVGMAQPVR